MFTNVGPATSHHSRVRGIHLRRWFDVFWGEEMRLPRIINGSRYVFCYIIWSMIMVIYGNVIYKCYIWFLGMFHPIPSYMTWSSNIGIGRKTNVWFDNVLIQKLIKSSFGSGFPGSPPCLMTSAGTKTGPIHQSGDCRPGHKNYRFMLGDAECMHA